MLALKVQVVLAAMLSLTPPGKSAYSRTFFEVCDETCQQKTFCELPSFMCDLPKFSQYAFEDKIRKALMQGLHDDGLNAYKVLARSSSWSRAETYEEGLSRYLVIAQAIAETAEDMSWRKGTNDTCKAVCDPTRALRSEECLDCVSAHPWIGTERELATALVVVMNEESGFRQDVHSGIGATARGDCSWRDKTSHKPAGAFAPGAEPISGTCKSVCLAQINLGRPDGTKFGYSADDLVGTGLESTKRCASASVRILSSSRFKCSGPGSNFRGDWAQGMFSAYGTGYTCEAEAKWLVKRTAEFHSLLKKQPGLSDEVKVKLGLLPSAPQKLSSME